MKHAEIVLRNMCKFVDADYDSIDFTHPTWFWTYQWDNKTQDTFISWLTDYLYNDKDARKELMRHPRKKRKECERAAVFFVWNYGWKLK